MSKVGFINRDIKRFKEMGDLDTNLISDGYHSIGELYKHRIALFIALCKEYISNPDQSKNAWRSKLHNDGSSFDGWFIVGIGQEKGKQISYHLPMSEWENTNFIRSYEAAPCKFDGHTSTDVLERLKNL